VISCYPFKDRLLIDEGFVKVLLPAGYLQIGNPDDSSYDPVCFDTNKKGECQIVRIDHEEILCRSRIRVVKVIAASFLELIESYKGNV